MVAITKTGYYVLSFAQFVYLIRVIRDKNKVPD